MSESRPLDFRGLDARTRSRVRTAAARLAAIPPGGSADAIFAALLILRDPIREQIYEEKRIGYLLVSDSLEVVEYNPRAFELVARYAAAAGVEPGRDTLRRFTERVRFETEGGRSWRIKSQDNRAWLEIDAHRIQPTVATIDRALTLVVMRAFEWTRPMSEITLQRHLRFLRMLHESRFGLTVRTLRKELGISRAAFYRYRDAILAAGYQLDRELQNGEARYRLIDKGVPSVPPTSWQSQGLRIARRLLAPLEGTRLVRELDALVPESARPRGPSLPVEAPAPPPLGTPETAAAVESAMLDSRRLAFTYAPANGDIAERTVDPLVLYVRDSQVYLDAFDIDKAKVSTFKIARMTDARVLDEPAEPHPEYAERREFAHTAKIWDGPLVTVVVRISPRGARFVHEWPLVESQEIEELPDGGVLVRARVSGTVEAMRWVLRWGKEALVLEPTELRSAVVTELLRAIAAYTGEGVSHS